MAEKAEQIVVDGKKLKQKLFRLPSWVSGGAKSIIDHILPGKSIEAEKKLGIENLIKECSKPLGKFRDGKRFKKFDPAKRKARNKMAAASRRANR